MNNIEKAIKIIETVKEYHSIGNADNWTAAKLDEALKLLITPDVANVVFSDMGGIAYTARCSICYTIVMPDEKICSGCRRMLNWEVNK